MDNSFLVVHIITGLQTGGAEMMLYKLLSKINRRRFEPVVISLIDKGTVGDRIESLGIPVYAIDLKPGLPKLASIWLLIRTVRQLKPDLIQGWMTHGNLASQLVSIFVPKQVPVLWNIRHSVLTKLDTKTGTLLISKLLSSLSYFPSKIIYNSQVSANDHQRVGYRSEKTVVIPNGFDTKLFVPSAEARISVRSELNLSEETFLIGLIGRFHSMKDHANFLKAASLLLQTHPEVHFLLAGRDVSWDNQVLRHLLSTLNIFKQIHLLGERQDIPRLTAALDISASASYSEGFPNVVGEAMSCGVPCVVTDVGDCALIVGDTGRVVPPREPEALSASWLQLIEMGTESRVKLGIKARQRIKEQYSLEKIVEHYEKLYEEQIYSR